MPFGPRKDRRVHPPVPPPPKPPKPPKPARVIGPVNRRTPTPPTPPRSVESYAEEETDYRRQAEAIHPDNRDAQDAFVYGKMRKHGWHPDHHSPWDGKSYRHWYFGKVKV